MSIAVAGSPGLSRNASSAGVNVIKNLSSSWPALKLVAAVNSDAGLDVFPTASATAAGVRLTGSSVQLGGGTAAPDITVGRLAAGYAWMLSGLLISSMPSGIAPLNVAGTKPATSVGGVNAQHITLSPGDGGDATSSSSFAGLGGNVVLSAGAGGTNSTTGIGMPGGNIVLTPGPNGAGTPAGSSELQITRGRVRVSGTLMGDRDSITMDSAGSIKASVKATPYNICENTGSTPGASTSNTPAQNVTAINNALNAAADKGDCFIPPQSSPYLIQQGISMPSFTRLYGAGKGRSIFKVDSSVSLTPGVELIHNSNFTTGNSNITLENFEIDGNRTGRGGPYYPGGAGTGIGMLVFRGGDSARNTNMRLLGMTIHDAHGIGVGFNSTDGVYVIGCEIYNNGRDGCSVLDDAPSGGDLNLPSRNIYFLNNHIYSCGDDCHAVTSEFNQTTGIENVVIANNILGDHPALPSGGQEGGHGVCVAGVTNALVVNNVIRNTYAGGIQISNGYLPNSGTSAKTSRLTVANNSISLAGAPRAAVNDVLGWGIELTQKFDAGVIEDVLIANNHIHLSLSHAIYMAKYSGGTGTIRHIQIQNNDIVGGGTDTAYANTAAGIFAGSTMNWIEIIGNHIRDTGSYAITNQNTGGQYWNIANNQIFSANRRFAGTGPAAVDLRSLTESQIMGNRIADLQGTRGSSHALNLTGSATMRAFNNIMVNSGYTAGATILGTIPAHQANNVNNAGTLVAGTATSGTL